MAASRTSTSLPHSRIFRSRAAASNQEARRTPPGSSSSTCAWPSATSSIFPVKRARITRRRNGREDYWPEEEAPPNPAAWDASIAAFQKDAQQLDRLVEDSRRDPFKPFSHGDGQTLLREALLVATHNSYHLGQLVFLKKTLLDTDVL